MNIGGGRLHDLAQLSALYAPTRNSPEANFSMRMLNPCFGIVTSLEHTQSAVQNLVYMFVNRELQFDRYKQSIRECFDCPDLLLEKLYKFELTKAIGASEAIFLNLVLLCILDQSSLVKKESKLKGEQSHKLRLLKDLILSGSRKADFISHHIADDLFMRNLSFISEVDSEYDFKPFWMCFNLWMKITELQDVYLLDTSSTKSLVKNRERYYQDFHRRLFSSTDPNEHKRVVYMQLFQQLSFQSKNLIDLTKKLISLKSTHQKLLDSAPSEIRLSGGLPNLNRDKLFSQLPWNFTDKRSHLLVSLKGIRASLTQLNIKNFKLVKDKKHLEKYISNIDKIAAILNEIFSVEVQKDKEILHNALSLFLEASLSVPAILDELESNP